MNHVMQQRNNYIRDRITLTSFAPVKHFFCISDMVYYFSSVKPHNNDSNLKWEFQNTRHYNMYI